MQLARYFNDAVDPVRDCQAHASCDLCSRVLPASVVLLKEEPRLILALMKKMDGLGQEPTLCNLAEMAKGRHRSGGAFDGIGRLPKNFSRAVCRATAGEVGRGRGTVLVHIGARGDICVPAVCPS